MMNFKRRKSFDDVPTSSKFANLGTESKRLHQNDQNQWAVQAASTGMQNTSVAQLPLEIDIDPLLKDIVFSEDLEQKKLVNRLYRDIYYNDPVCGSAVDMFSTLPFSEFTFGGVTDKRARQAFGETIERLNCRTLMPHISTDHLVDGSYISSLLFNKTSKRFFDTMPHRSSDCKVETLPFYSQDPIITAAISDEIRNLFNVKDSKRMTNMRDRLGPELVALLGNDAIELDPLTTVYIPRKIFTTDEGVSWFRRVLPIWLIEKNLFRGTLVESSRRQRGILHLELGDGDQWEPTIADMEFITELFQNADADPLGAIIATRMGVSTNEIRCIAGETRVLTDAGLLRIDELVGHTPDGTPFSASTDIKVQSPAGGFVAVDQWHYQGFQKTTTLTTESGAALTATANHKHLVLTYDGELRLLPVRDITARHWLCVEDNAKYASKKHKNNKAYGVLASHGFHFESIVGIKQGGHRHVYDLSIKGNEDGEAPLFVAGGIVTHNSGGDFWKVTDIWDSTSQFKMRALGISEGFLTGETTLGTADNSMTLLIETIRTFRDMITRKFFYDKLFPLISLVNGFTINDAGKLIRKDGLLTGDIQDNLNKLANGSRLLVPTIHWNKQLKPEGDSTYIDILGTLTEKGIPVPLRAFAAAGGVNLDNLINDSEDDITLLKKISEYNKKVADIKKEFGPPVADDGMSMASAGDKSLLKVLADAKQSPSSVLREGTGRPVPLGARDFGDASEIVGRTPTGKKKYLRNQRQENEKANKNIVRAMQEIIKHKNTPLTRSTMTAHTGA